MNTIGLLATVVIRLASYGGGATFEGGDFDLAAYRPGWEGGVPRDAYRVSHDWRQETNGVCVIADDELVESGVCARIGGIAAGWWGGS